MPSPEALTEDGRRWATAKAATGDRVAAVALDGTGWPEAHVATAVRIANEQGEREAQADA